MTDSCGRQHIKGMMDGNENVVLGGIGNARDVKIQLNYLQ